MTNILLLVILVVLVGFAVSFVQRRRRSLVPRRGMSVGADLGVLADQPRVRVRELTIAGPDSVRLVLTREAGDADLVAAGRSSDLVFVVALHQDDSGYELLQEWQRSASSLAIVLPPGSRLVRLRSIDDLQPLTLRRVDQD